jgi:L-ascorbate metabolism protein UlaG (beta-lactamase superfamily)
MKLHFLGTGAADWDITKPRRDINYRRYSSLLIDGKLLVDPGPCVFEFAETYGYPALFDGLEYMVNTHTHSDHLCPGTVERLETQGARFIPLDAFEEKKFGSYTVTALPANHASAENPCCLVIESVSKRIFYGCDGAWLLYPTCRYLMKLKFDLMIFDATIGDIEGDYRIFEHNNLRMVEEMKSTLSGCSRRFMISDMARTLHTDHLTLAERMKRSDIEVAYDDLQLEL